MPETRPDGDIAIYVDADACPVKDEVYRVAGRYGLHVHVVSNRFMAVPREPWIERVVVGEGLDVADDWIAARAGPGAIVVTADVPLASRCVKAGAVALAPNGRPFTESSVGLALATRNLMQDLREAGAVTGGPRPFSARDRSAFLGALDRAVVRLRRTPPAPPAPRPSVEEVKEDSRVTKLFIAHLRGPDGPRPLVTVRAEAEGEARLFLAAAYPDDAVLAVDEPGEWVSDADTGAKAGDVREHPGVEWQPPGSLADG